MNLSKGKNKSVGLPGLYWYHLALVVAGSQLVIFVLAVLVNGIPSAFWAPVGFGNFSETKLLAASQVVVQFDSFATAAWVAGFALFWGLLSKQSEALEREIFETNNVIEDRIEEGKSVESKLAAQELVELNRNWLEDLRSRRKAFLESALTPLFSFVSSGLAAIVSILTENALYVWASLDFFVYAIGLTMLSWYWLYDYSSHLSERAIQAASWTRQIRKLASSK